MVGKHTHSQSIEALLFTMCSVFIRLVFSTDFNEALPAKPLKAQSKPAAFLQSMKHRLLLLLLVHFWNMLILLKALQLTSVCVCVVASPASGGNGVLRWRTDSFPVFMSGLEYKNNSLHVQQDGHYYIFSKIAHLEKCNYFKHQVMQCTDKYNSKAIELMQSSRYSTPHHRSLQVTTASAGAHPCLPCRFICGASDSPWMGNSYLGGVFQLSKGDSVFVRVNNSSQVNGDAHENFFGAFMV